MKSKSGLRRSIRNVKLMSPVALIFVGLLSADLAYPREKLKNPQVGKAASVINMVIGDNLDELRELTVDDPVYALERVSAEPDSHGELLLSDNTRIIVGPGAEISLDDFVVANNGIKSGTLNIIKGAFRFISGNSPKNTFKVVTPLSTIGIRGTSFDVYVDDDGQTDVIIYTGQVNVCTLGNICRILHKPCDIVRVTKRQKLQTKRFLRSGNKSRENKKYTLVANQERFQQGWQAPIDSCDSRGAKARKGFFNIEDGIGQDADPDGPGNNGTGTGTGTGY